MFAQIEKSTQSSTKKEAIRCWESWGVGVDKLQNTCSTYIWQYPSKTIDYKLCDSHGTTLSLRGASGQLFPVTLVSLVIKYTILTVTHILLKTLKHTALYLPHMLKTQSLPYVAAGHWSSASQAIRVNCHWTTCTWHHNLASLLSKHVKTHFFFSLKKFQAQSKDKSGKQVRINEMNTETQ